MEIDVSKCKFCYTVSGQPLCIIGANDTRYDDGCMENPNCYYRQLQQLKQENEKLRFPREDIDFAVLTKEEFENYNKLKVENEELKENLAINKDAFNSICVEKYKLENCLDEIEEIVRDFHLSMIMFHKGTTHEMADRIDYYLDEIKQLIKQAKEDK